MGSLFSWYRRYKFDIVEYDEVKEIDIPIRVIKGMLFDYINTANYITIIRYPNSLLLNKLQYFYDRNDSLNSYLFFINNEEYLNYLLEHELLYRATLNNLIKKND